jgi:hypothetical protein
MRRFILIILICFIAFPAFSMSKDDYIDDATTIISLFETQYAPLKWKEKNLGLNFSEMSAKFLADASNCKSDKEFYEIVAKFLASFEDAHISYQIPSTYLSRLPFNVRYIQGEALISFIDDEEVTKEQFPFKRGDTLVEIDGVDVREIADNLLKYIKVGYDRADNIYGYHFLTKRMQRMFPYIPTGKSKVTIKPSNGGSSKIIELEWITTGYDIPEKPAGAVFNMMKMFETGKTDNTIPDYDKIHDPLHAANNSDRDIKPFFELWDGFTTRAEDPFLSGTFELDDKKIGYLKIDTWSGESLPEFDKIGEFLNNEISYFSGNTEALIIDQTYNRGGNGCYAVAIASYLTGIPRNEIRDQLRANNLVLAERAERLLNYDGANSDLVEKWVNDSKNAIERGDFLTPPIPGCRPTGVLLPSRDKDGNIIVYYKPILVLNNAFSASASEYFSAQLQDWGVATIFGENTIGAGGGVIFANFLGHSELTIKLVQSLGYREKEVISPEGNRTHYIEDVGVTPDIPYEITIEDFLNGYKGYREAVNNAVLSLIQK